MFNAIKNSIHKQKTACKSHFLFKIEKYGQFLQKNIQNKVPRKNATTFHVYKIFKTDILSYYFASSVTRKVETRCIKKRILFGQCFGYKLGAGLKMLRSLEFSDFKKPYLDCR